MKWNLRKRYTVLDFVAYAVFPYRETGKNCGKQIPLIRRWFNIGRSLPPSALCCSPWSENRPFRLCPSLPDSVSPVLFVIFLQIERFCALSWKQSWNVVKIGSLSLHRTKGPPFISVHLSRSICSSTVPPCILIFPALFIKIDSPYAREENWFVFHFGWFYLVWFRCIIFRLFSARRKNYAEQIFRNLCCAIFGNIRVFVVYI